MRASYSLLKRPTEKTQSRPFLLLKNFAFYEIKLLLVAEDLSEEASALSVLIGGLF